MTVSFLCIEVEKLDLILHFDNISQGVFSNN